MEAKYVALKGVAQDRK